MYPELSDIQTAFPNLDPRLLGHDIAYPGDAEVPARRLHRPDGRRPDRGQLVDDPDAPELGRVVPGARLLPAVHQRKDATEKHYVLAGRVATVVLFVCSSALVFVLDTAKDAFDIILQVGAGTGLLYLVRWFWWRVNAWCEVVAMVSSFAVSIVAAGAGEERRCTSARTWRCSITIAVTTVCWVRPRSRPGDRPRDADRVLHEGPAVRPGLGADPRGSRPGRRTSSARDAATTSRWRCSAGCRAARMIWSALFTVGNFLYGRTGMATMLLAAFGVSAAALIWVVRRLWAPDAASAPCRARVRQVPALPPA